MRIPVVLVNGAERTVSKTELQFLIVHERWPVFFQRPDGWVVVGRDQMRNDHSVYADTDRRLAEAFTKSKWY